MTRICLLVLGAVALGACDALTHEPSGENPVDVDPTPAALVVDLRDAPDTLVVWDEVTFRYAVSTEPGRAVDAVEIWFDDQKVAEPNDRFRATVETSVVPDGTYTLRVVTTAPAGTGSLADTLGAETQTVEDTRVVVVDNAPVEPTAVTYGERDGQLEVRWAARPRPSFERYRLFRVDADGRRTLVLDTETPADTAWADDRFVSGRAGFAVDVTARGQTATGDAAVQTFAPPSLVEIEAPAPDRRRFRWTAAPFPATFQAYEIREGGLGSGFTPVARIEAVGDTTAVVDLPDVFGATLRYELRTQTIFGWHIPGGTAPGITQDPTAPLDRLIGAADGALIGVVGTDVVRASPTDFATLATFATSDLRDVVVSRSGQVGVFSGTPPPYRRRVSLLDGTSLAVVGEFIQEEVHGDRASLMNSSRKVLTDDGSLLSSYGEYWSPTYYGNLGALRVDMTDGAVLNRIDATGTRPPSFNVNYNSVEMRGGTPDGRYAVFSVRGAGVALYEALPDGTFERRTAVGNGTLVFVDDDTAARLVSGRIEVLDVPSLAVQASFPAPEMEALSTYDAPTGRFVGWGSPSYPSAPARMVGYDADTRALAFGVDVGYGTQYIAGFLWAEGRYRRVAPLL